MAERRTHEATARPPLLSHHLGLFWATCPPFPDRALLLLPLRRCFRRSALSPLALRRAPGLVLRAPGLACRRFTLLVVFTRQAVAGIAASAWHRSALRLGPRSFSVVPRTLSAPSRASALSGSLLWVFGGTLRNPKVPSPPGRLPGGFSSPSCPAPWPLLAVAAPLPSPPFPWGSSSSHIRF